MHRNTLLRVFLQQLADKLFCILGYKAPLLHGKLKGCLAHFLHQLIVKAMLGYE